MKTGLRVNEPNKKRYKVNTDLEVKPRTAHEYYLSAKQNFKLEGRETIACDQLFKATEAHYPPAMLYGAKLLLTGKYITQKPKIAISYLNHLIRQGYLPAILFACKHLIIGKYLKRDIELAINSLIGIMQNHKEFASIKKNKGKIEYCFRYILKFLDTDDKILFREKVDIINNQLKNIGSYRFFISLKK